MRRGRARSPEEPKKSGRSRSCEKISSLRRVAGVPNLCNDRGQRAGNVGKGESYSGFSERVCQFISGKFSVTGNQLEA